jgi:hypothetical protein
MKLLKGWKLRILTGLALASMGGQVHAQMKPGSMDPSMLGGRGPMGPASYRMPGPPPGMMQDPMAGEMGPMGGPMAMDPSQGMPEYGNQYGMAGSEGYSQACGQDCGPNCGGGQGGSGCTCGRCGGLGGRLGRGGLLGGSGCTDMFGRDRCGFVDSMRGKLGSCRGSLRPYGEGGIATQRWFDVYAEAMFLKRTSGINNFVTSTRGIGPTTPVLGTSQVNPDQLQPGLSLQLNVQTGPGSNLEFTYFGLNEWKNSASATSDPPGTLFSFISNFGTLPNGGFDDPDRSVLHSLNYRSRMNNGEINFRRRWSEPHGFLQGSFLMGIRYFDLDEAANFSATGTLNNTSLANTLRFFNYNSRTENALVGFQVGGDLWYNVYPGIKLGVDGKTGIYNNRVSQKATITANSVPQYDESIVTNKAAYITQIAPQLYYRLNYSWAFRSSYQLIYVRNVALAAENFNPIPPTTFVQNSTRAPQVNPNSDLVLQGFTVGAEYTW